MQATALSPVMGLRVDGIDLSHDLEPAKVQEIERLLAEGQLLAFSGQSLTPERQIAFSRNFGELDIHVVSQFNHPEMPEVFLLSNRIVDGKPVGASDGGSYWHSDFAFQECPAKTTILHAIEVPEGAGNTLFANMEKAYEALSPEWKQRLEGRQAIHRYRKAVKKGDDISRGTRVELTEEQKAKTPDVLHPVVRTHPLSRRRSIFVHPGAAAEIAGASAEESEEILSYLFAHCIRPEFRFDYVWRAGDVVMWDNRNSMHSATTNQLEPGQFRTIHRTTVRGDRPF